MTSVENKDMTTISIIMVTRQAGEMIYRSIASVLEQDSKLELIIVNNGNPPQVEATMVDKFKDVPNVRLMTGHEDIGIVKGRNLGARAATGDYLLFIDDNCILPSNALSLLKQEAAQREEAFLLGARIVDQKGQEIKGSRLALLTPPIAFMNYLQLSRIFPEQRLWLHGSEMPSKTVLVPALGGSFLFGSKAVFSSFMGFDENYFSGLASIDFCFRFAQDGGVIAFMPQLVVQQMLPQSQPYDMAATKNRLKAYMRYFFSNFADSYPQPVLWALYLLYSGVFLVNTALRRKNGVL